MNQLTNFNTKSFPACLAQVYNMTASPFPFMFTIFINASHLILSTFSDSSGSYQFSGNQKNWPLGR